MPTAQAESPALIVLVFVVGLCVGSFLNVLALRSLAGQSILWPPSRCPSCGKGLGVLDNVPLISFILLSGRCRHCRAPISWQYPAVELFTAVSLTVLFIVFGPTAQAAAMSVFVCTLIAVTITDFREKLIPHDITYPSMLMGIAFSASVRNDLLGALAGIGASYILFDFIAHYGLKVYRAARGKEEDDTGEPLDLSVDAALSLSGGQPAAEEEVEVMGGGDAVLSAVISAWLGWQRLALALLVAFLVGTVMGLLCLVREMARASILAKAIRPASAGACIGFALAALPVVAVAVASGLAVDSIPWLALGLIGSAAGATLGFLSVGSRVSRPFPFGPALAAGGMTAIFWDPIGSLGNTGS